MTQQAEKGSWGPTEGQRSDIYQAARDVLEAFGKRRLLVGSRRVKDITGLEIIPYKDETEYTLQRCVGIKDGKRTVYFEDWKQSYLVEGSWIDRLTSLHRYAKEKLQKETSSKKEKPVDLLIRPTAHIEVQKKE